MFDIFYHGRRPGVSALEQEACNIEHASKLCRTRFFWWIHYLADLDHWDFSWEPPPWQAHQRHAWASQWQPDSGVYLVPALGYQDTHYHQEQIQRRADRSLWHIPSNIDAAQFDFSWHPNPCEPNYHYHFGTQWQLAGGPSLPGTAGKKTVEWPKAVAMPTDQYWFLPDHIDHEKFDTSWHPDPFDPPLIYQFATQHQKTGGPVYTVPGAIDTAYVSLPAAKKVTVDDCWTVPKHIDRDSFDWTWHPDHTDPPLIYQFATQHQKTGGPIYTMPGATSIAYVTYPAAKKITVDDCWTVPDGIDSSSFDWTWHPDHTDPPLIYQFATQHQKTGGPVYTVPGATDITYVFRPSAKKTSVDNCWTVPDGIDSGSFDWTWHPDHTDPPLIYQFATQHQKTGGPVYTVPGATEVKYMEHVAVPVHNQSVPVVEIDHLDGHAGQIANTVKTVRYFDNYRDTLLRIARNLKGQHEWIWICSSICDYSNFDFSWHPEQWQSTMLHVFASDEQKFGDTFYMHVPTFAERAEKKALLEWYAVNFVPKISVPRRPVCVIVHDQDSQVDAVKNTDWPGPVAVFTNTDYVDRAMVTVPLWRAETKAIVPVSSGAGTVIVPKTAVPYIKTQLYDYPHIDKTNKFLLDQPLDIVFVSNGEPCADQNYQQLLISCRAVPNRIHRVDGITGRAAAYHAAARASTTPWFFAVFAKLWITNDFDWAWQPDRMQQPKHYIFHARNPVNGLVYGHQAMIAYNQKLVLANPGLGLDFTLDSAHEVVPILSGVALYNWSPWMAWRTAFREVVKLRASLPDVENEYRINRWCIDGQGHNAEWSNMGAQDALEYFDSVNGDMAELRRSYEWSWLASYAFMRRKLVPDP